MNAVFSFDATSREPEFSQWGGFLNASVGNGDKRATGNENAFDFDTTEFALGIDRRFANGLVLGAIATYSEQEIEFDNDAGTVSVVDGDISAEGVGGLAFALWTGEQWFVSTSLGFQSIDYDMRRDIRYPSFNPNLPDSNSTTTSTPQSDIVSLTLDAGYTLNAGPITIEPFVGVDYLDITIDAFDEARSFNSLSGIFDTDGFNLTVAGQDFRSIDTAFGLRLQTTLTPDFGVIMPYLTVEYHLELETDPRVIRARYAGAGNEAFTFEVPTDPFDSDYFTWSAGLSSVVRGARQRRAGSAAAGGVSVFAQYQSVERLDNFDEQIVSAGIRYEF
jgi:outer membrane autotransporter protein